MDFSLLKKLTQISGASSDESRIKAFILDYIEKNKQQWKVQPQIISTFQDNIILIFGDQPKLAFYAHLDTVGYTLADENKLFSIGGPVKESEILLKHHLDSELQAQTFLDAKTLKLSFLDEKNQEKVKKSAIFTYDAPCIEEKNQIQSAYLDNRLGCFLLLKLAENLTSGALVFSCLEEVGVGTAAYLAKFLLENYQIDKAIISDVTFANDYIFLDQGPVLSWRDGSLPRQKFIREIHEILTKAKINFQEEVENFGGSDGSHIQKAFLPIDWAFLGVPILNMHSPKEIANISTIQKTLEIYHFLAENQKF